MMRSEIIKMLDKADEEIRKAIADTPYDRDEREKLKTAREKVQEAITRLLA